MARKDSETPQPTVGRREIAGVLHIDYGPDKQVIRVAAMLTGVAFKERDTWVSYCRELDLSSCGDTQEEAKRRLDEAIEAFFEDCIEERTLERALAELGWKCRTRDNRLLECSEVEFPRWTLPAFMINRMGKGSEWQMRLRLSEARH